MLSRVQEYNLYGSVARLPDLNTGRDWHSCGHYVHNGQMVGSVFSYDIRSKQNKGSLKKHFIFDQCENDLFYSLNHLSSKKCYPQRRPPASVPCIFRLTIITFWVQVFIVTGGNHRPPQLLSSTETWTRGSSAWTSAADLPSPRVGMAGVTIGSNFFVIGEQTQTQGVVFNAMLWLLCTVQYRVFPLTVKIHLSITDTSVQCDTLIFYLKQPRIMFKKLRSEGRHQ